MEAINILPVINASSKGNLISIDSNVISIVDSLLPCSDKCSSISFIIRGIKLINREYCGDLTLHRIASELYLSEQYVERIIRKQYGTSLKKLVFAKRMDTAGILLLTTDETVEVIGQKVGFRAKSGFYRTFRDCFGMTPAQ